MEIVPEDKRRKKGEIKNKKQPENSNTGSPLENPLMLVTKEKAQFRDSVW